MNVTREMIEETWKACGVIESPERDMSNERALAIRVVMLNHRRKLVERRMAADYSRLREIKQIALSQPSDAQKALAEIAALASQSVGL